MFAEFSPCFLATATLTPREKSAWTRTLFLPAASIATSRASRSVILYPSTISIGMFLVADISSICSVLPSTNTTRTPREWSRPTSWTIPSSAAFLEEEEEEEASPSPSAPRAVPRMTAPGMTMTTTEPWCATM